MTCLAREELKVKIFFLNASRRISILFILLLILSMTIYTVNVLTFCTLKLASVAQLDACPTGDWVVGSIPTGSATFFCGD